MTAYQSIWLKSPHAWLQTQKSCFPFVAYLSAPLQVCAAYPSACTHALYHTAFNGGSSGKLQTRLFLEHTPLWTSGHTPVPSPCGRQRSTPNCAHTQTRAHTQYMHIRTHRLFFRGFSFHFPKKSTLTLKLIYGLPTLLLLYVFPLEAITVQATVLPPTFSCGFITFGQRASLFMSSMHCNRRKTSYMILQSIMEYVSLV